MQKEVCALLNCKATPAVAVPARFLRTVVESWREHLILLLRMSLRIPGHFRFGILTRSGKSPGSPGTHSGYGPANGLPMAERSCRRLMTTRSNCGTPKPGNNWLPCQDTGAV